MIFKGEPGLVVMDHITGQKLFNFNDKGEFETTDETLVNRMKPYFEVKLNKKNPRLNAQ